MDIAGNDKQLALPAFPIVERFDQSIVFARLADGNLQREAAPFSGPFRPLVDTGIVLKRADSDQRIVGCGPQKREFLDKSGFPLVERQRVFKIAEPPALLRRLQGQETLAFGVAFQSARAQAKTECTGYRQNTLCDLFAIFRTVPAGTSFSM